MGGFGRVSSFQHMMKVLHGNLKSRANCFEMQEIGKVPMSGKYSISSITWLFQSTENHSELENHQFQLWIMGSLHESKG
jgi:hypothetical protein